MSNREALNKLKELSQKLEIAEYDFIVDLLKNKIKRIPIPLAKLKPRSAIDRVRMNIENNLFKSVNELGYIKDKEVIKNMTEFGRANLPHQPMFYGAIETTIIDKQRVTALAETSSYFKDKELVDLDGKLFTVSRWRTKEEMIIAEVVFSENAIKSNPDTKRAFEKQKQFAIDTKEPDVEFLLDFLIFISEEFARPKKTHNDYKISTAYSNLIHSHPNVQGIAFPSVQTQYVGENIVLKPDIVNNLIEIDVLSTQILYKNKERIFVANYKNCNNPRECYDNIEWKDLPEELLSNKEDVAKHLQLI